MNWYRRALSGLLAGAMGVSLLGTAPVAAAAETRGAGTVQDAEGEITVTLRLDYPMTVSGWKARAPKVTLKRDGAALLQAGLEKAQTLPDGGKGSVEIALRTEGEEVRYVDMTFAGLSAREGENTYALSLEGTGFCPYTTPELTLDTHSKGVVLGTGDATFTLGDVTGDGLADQRDVARVRDALDTADAACDLNGDGVVDISDLATVTMAQDAQGTAQIFQTALIPANTLDLERIQEAVTAAAVVEGTVSDLFADNGQSVKLSPKGEENTITLPIPLTEEGVEMEEVAIVSSAAYPVETGVVVAETASGETLEIPFSQALPEGVYAITRTDDGRRTVTISLGNRVPVKKITIRVETKGDEPVVVEQIRFLQDIVPEEPAVHKPKVEQLRAEAGVESVTLRWKGVANVTGYRVDYGTSPDALNQSVESGETTCVISKLEALKPYYFAVTPISDAGGSRWEGARSEVVTATPKVESRPDRPDRLQVEPGDSLLTVSWQPGKRTQYVRVEYRKKGEAAFQTLSGSFQNNSAVIGGLENGTEYEVRVYGVNELGQSPYSETVLGTPKTAEFETPDLPTANRLDNQSIIVSADYPSGNTDWTVSKGTLPGSVYDGDYRTSWVASTYNRSRAFTFTFDQAYSMDYLIYVPDLGNEPSGQKRPYRNFFDKFNVSINGQAVPEDQVSFEKGENNTYFIVKFPRSDVKTITVEGSQWAGAGNISLSEIAFYQYDGLADEINALFANESHTELAQGVEEGTIEALRTRASRAEAYYVDRKILLDELDNAQQLLEGRRNELMVYSGLQSRSAGADQAAFGQSASALQPLGVSARSGAWITVYVQGIQPGESVKLVQWQQYSETNATRAEYALRNGRNQIWLQVIGNSGLGERGGSLYVEYAGSHGEDIQLQIRDVSENKTVISVIPTLDLSGADWYGHSEQERKEQIKPYVETLKTYVAGLSLSNDQAKKTSIRNMTEVGGPGMLLSLPATQVLAGLGGAQASVEVMTDKLYDALCAWEELLFLANKTQGIISADTSFADYQYPMSTRHNIRFSRMFSGAFMFAAGSYVGIEFSETSGMVTGAPLAETGTGANALFGWGIAHEIGHNMDKIGKAEITNNIYSLVAQTAEETGELTGRSRLEESGFYSDIFQKTALGKPGEAANVFVQLGMYWQLHLAYDEGGSVLEGNGPLDFYNRFFTLWKSDAEKNVPVNDRIARLASQVAGKDLSAFFQHWGMELSQETLAYLAAQGEPEEREIWYLSDESRRLRLDGAERAHVPPTLESTASGGKTVELTISVDDPAMVQGYEILRNGTPVAFLCADGTAVQTYTDQVGAANHMVFTYQVRAIDKLGYEAGVSEEQQVRISYEKTLSPELYEIRRDEMGRVHITAREGLLSTAGLLLTGEMIPAEGNVQAWVTDDAGAQPLEGWTLARETSFQGGETFLCYFQKPGADADDTRIWIYDAAQIILTGIPEEMALEDIQLLDYPGDNIEFTPGASIGVLEEDFTYDTEEGKESIPAGTVIITGSYRGDPLYNKVRILGKFQERKPASDEAPVLREEILEGDALLFAEIPEDGAVSDISDGFFLFVPLDQDLFKAVNEDHGEKPSAGTAVLIELKAQLYRGEDIEVNGERMTSDTLFISVPRYDSMPAIRFTTEE